MTDIAFTRPAPRARRSGVVGRAARRMIERQLLALGHGRLTVADADGRRTFGRAADIAATITVADSAAYLRVLAGGSLGAARSYVRGEWRADDLVAACRIMARNLDIADRLDSGWAEWTKPIFSAVHWARQNTRAGSRRNIRAHYDLGNDFFRLFLDESMTYSCGVFDRDRTSLSDAQLAKIDRICDKLALTPSDHLLEIGSGWGALAVRAATKYGCRVTTTTISRQQFEETTARIKDAGLSDRVQVLLSDYRDLNGTYDALVSVEMIEAVGAQYLNEFFSTCGRLLKPGSRMALQAITVPDHRYETYLRSVDFIRQDVFPGSSLVCTRAMNESARAAGLNLESTDDLTPHYARTLREWRRRFLARLDDVRQLGYSEEFIRRWEFYLASCEAGFAERTTGLVQVTYAAGGDRA